MSEAHRKMHFKIVNFMHQAALRLRMTGIPVATACAIYHKFFSEYSTQDFDPYLIGATALYLAGKVEEQVVHLRDVVNVCYRVYHPNKQRLEVGDTFSMLKDSMASCELLVLRCLQFKVIFHHPHKYLLHYLKSLQSWFSRDVWSDVPLADTSWAILRDIYHFDTCINYSPEHLAISIIYLSLLSLGCQLPYVSCSDTPWWKVFSDTITLPVIHEIIIGIVSIYDLETSIR